MMAKGADVERGARARAVRSGGSIMLLRFFARESVEGMIQPMLDVT